MAHSLREVVGLGNAALRRLPQVEKAMADPRAATLVAAYSRAAVLAALRALLDEERRALRAGAAAMTATAPDRLFAALGERLAAERQPVLRRVINATGIVIHTNLGRAPLAPEAIAAAAEMARGYGNLEFDLETGRRGSRYQAVEALLCRLTGAEAALVVNNNAAAVLLALGALSRGGEVVVSRGELVEIGGSFRLPDVITQSGARLVEVGTTNRTRVADYEAAIGAETRVLLKVHRSNFRITGFTGMATLAELVALGRGHGLPVVEDLGSGTLVALRRFGLPDEPTVRDSVAVGADLVAFSGDKLLGGPQAGILVGRRDLIARLGTEPLLRALRIDKLSLAALEATLRLHLDEDRLAERLPVLRMLAQDERRLARRAARLKRRLAAIPGLDVAASSGIGYAGGGALPDAPLPTRLVTLRPKALGLDELAARLRRHRPAVVGRIAEGRLVLDLRTVADDEVPDLARALAEVLA